MTRGACYTEDPSGEGSSSSWEGLLVSSRWITYEADPSAGRIPNMKFLCLDPGNPSSGLAVVHLAARPYLCLRVPGFRPWHLADPSSCLGVLELLFRFHYSSTYASNLPMHCSCREAPGCGPLVKVNYVPQACTFYRRLIRTRHLRTWRPRTAFWMCLLFGQRITLWYGILFAGLSRPGRPGIGPA